VDVFDIELDAGDAGDAGAAAGAGAPTGVAEGLEHAATSIAAQTAEKRTLMESGRVE
jgi:hypothetical protein